VERNLTAFRVTVEELTRCVAALLDDLEGEGDQLNVAKIRYADKSKQSSDVIEKLFAGFPLRKRSSSRIWRLDLKRKKRQKQQQLAVAQVLERVFAKIEIGVKEDF